MSIETFCPRIALTAGEPAGIGPDIVIQTAQRSFPAQLVLVADPELIRARASRLRLPLELIPYNPETMSRSHVAGTLLVAPVPLAMTCTPGTPDPGNAAYVLETLRVACRGCRQREFAAMVTAPVHKAVINEAGHVFSGHTEFLAALCGVTCPVMMLVDQTLRVALVTTHLPLAMVSKAITADRLECVLRVLWRDLQDYCGISDPRLLVCGLNPHAGEAGHLGREEIEIIMPALEKLRHAGLRINGPVAADTAFTPERLAQADVVVTMFHDQGLPVLKSRGFGSIVNITLGLPIIRTSVDHGTALSLAGTGQAGCSSLNAAIECALQMALTKHYRKKQAGSATDRPVQIL